MRSLLLAATLTLANLASAQVLDSRTFSTDGHPMQAIWSPDGQHVLVTVSRPRESGIEVFAVDGDKLKREAYQPVGSNNAQGILFIPHTGLLAIGLTDAGVGFLPLDATLKGTAQPRAILQGDRSGSLFLAVTPDSKTLFVANEYLRNGSVGVIALGRDQNRLTPITTAQIQTQIATPGIAISPDGTRLYAVSEVLPRVLSEKIPGHDRELEHGGCTQGAGGSQPNGALYVIDTAKAAALPLASTAQQEHDATPGLINAGCSPVRVAVSSDGHTVYVTARGDNRVLVFDAAALEHDPNHALLHAIPTGGDAPVGLALFDHDRKLLVANSNRFSGGSGNVTVIDLATDPANPKVVQTIKTGDFPRNITTSADGRSLLVTVYLSNEVMLLTMK